MSDAMNNVKLIDIDNYFVKTNKTAKDLATTLTDAQKRTQDIANTVQTSMTDALMGLSDRTLTVKDAFQNMARDIISQLYRVLIVQRMVNAAMGFMGFSKAQQVDLQNFQTLLKEQWVGLFLAGERIWLASVAQR